MTVKVVKLFFKNVNQTTSIQATDPNFPILERKMTYMNDMFCFRLEIAMQKFALTHILLT